MRGKLHVQVTGPGKAVKAGGGIRVRLTTAYTVTRLSRCLEYKLSYFYLFQVNIF